MVRRIYLLWRHPIFYESMRLVLSHPDIVLIGANSDYESAGANIYDLHPDVVLVEEGTEDSAAILTEILQQCPPSIRLIGLNISDNHLNIYQRQQAHISKPRDLLSLLLQETA